jgi:tetratricopeptide (TPR) repeat protein
MRSAASVTEQVNVLLATELEKYFDKQTWVIKMEEEAEQWLSLAMKSKNPSAKLEYCTKFLETHPNDIDVWRYKGHILSEYLGREKEAINYNRSKRKITIRAIFVRSGLCR